MHIELYVFITFIHLFILFLASIGLATRRVLQMHGHFRRRSSFCFSGVYAYVHVYASKYPGLDLKIWAALHLVSMP